MSNIPDRIYLQWHGDGDPEDEAPVDDVTWAADKVFDNDIEYRRVTECVWKRHETHFGPYYCPTCREWNESKIDDDSYLGWIGGKYCPYCGNEIRVEEG